MLVEFDLVAPSLRRSDVRVVLLDREETLSRMPVVFRGYFDGAVFFPENGHIDVNELLWAYLRHARPAIPSLSVS